MSEELSDYRDTIRKLYELGILQTIKQLADKKYTGTFILTLNCNSGGFGEVYGERFRERIKR